MFRPAELVERTHRLVHGRPPVISGMEEPHDQVLCIEDNDDNVYMLKMRLELLDEFEVLTAEEGENGCNTAAAERSRGYCAGGSFLAPRLSRRLAAARERSLLGRSPRQPPRHRARP